MRLRKRTLHIILGVLLGLLFFFLLKSCIGDHLGEELYIIGQDTRWKELKLRGKERNLVVFNNDLLTQIAHEEEFRIRITSSVHLIHELNEGKLDAILTVMNPEDMKGHYLFSDPYFLTGAVLILPFNAKVKREGKKINVIAIRPDSPLISVLGIDPTIRVKIYDHILDALEDVRMKKIDGAIFPALTAYYYLDSFFRGELRVATSPLTDEGIRLATLNNEKGKTLIEKFDRGIKKLKEEGEYQALLSRRGLYNTELPSQ